MVTTSTAAAAATSSPCILNRVPRDKLPRVLAHILDKLSATDSGDVFSATEKQQLCEMLALSSLAQVDEIAHVITRVFVDAAHFGCIDRHHALLQQPNGSVEPDVLALIEKAWRKKGSAAAPQIAASHKLDTSTAPLLVDSSWRLHLEMGQSVVRGQSDPTAIFQLALQDPSAAQLDEMLDVEMSHDELRAFFEQLNAIQAAMDRSVNAA